MGQAFDGSWVTGSVGLMGRGSKSMTHSQLIANRNTDIFLEKMPTTQLITIYRQIVTYITALEFFCVIV